MAKRKRTRRMHSRRVASSRHVTRRRSRRRSHLGAGVFSNPLIGVAAGAVAAGLVGGILAKPKADGKPMIANPMIRLAAAAGAGFMVGKLLKAPAVGLGAVAAAAYVAAGSTVFGGKAYGLGDAEISYVDKALLSEPSTLAEGTTLSDANGNVLGVYQGGSWRGPYSAAGY